MDDACAYADRHGERFNARKPGRHVFGSVTTEAFRIGRFEGDQVDSGASTPPIVVAAGADTLGLRPSTKGIHEIAPLRVGRCAHDPRELVP